ncbi:MAG: S41 family peptidase, partial [Flammeovirgaceae bacterium]
LLNHLADTRYRVHEKKWWMSDSYKTNIREMFPWYMRPLGLKMMGVKEYLDSPSNTYYKFDENEWYTYPKQQIHQFRGKTYFVIGPGTFSSAIYTGVVVQDNKIAQLIGQPSGDGANSIGENCNLKLPHSGIVVSIPSAVFFRPVANSATGAPLIPDILIDSDTLDIMYDRINICRWLIDKK